MNSSTNYTEILLKATKEENLQVLRSFAEFWKVPYTLQPSSTEQPVVSSGMIRENEARTGSPTVFCPAGLGDARAISSKLDLEMSVGKQRISLPYSASAATSMEATLYQFRGKPLETVLESNGTPILSRVRNTSSYLLSVDLVSELSIRLYQGLEDPPSMKFRLATRLPLSYKAIPTFIRERAFRTNTPGDPSDEKIGPIECLRTIFLASIATVSENPIPLIGFWRRGKKFALAVTHDVETLRGFLKGSQQLQSVEEHLNIRSTWNIIANKYPLDRANLDTLSGSGEIGGHDTEHDGRLIFLPAEARISRLRKCRETLERLSGKKVRGFRAPLLQHDRDLIGAVGKAGYQFDSSVPSWELRSPTSLKEHGVGTVFPFRIDGTLELPVSLPQDHQLLRVQGLTLPQAGDELIRVSKWIREIGGLCTLLVHPDYEFAYEDQGAEYSRVLQSFREDPRCEIITLGEAADWWSLRTKAYVGFAEGQPRIFSPEAEEATQFEGLLVTSYGSKGFTMEKFN